MSEIKVQHILTIAELLLRGARDNYVTITTRELGAKIGRSQQAASKHLLELEEKGYISRRKSGQGFCVRVTEKGYREVQELFIRLKAAIEPLPKVIELIGVAVAGMGEGGYYMSLEGYRRQFLERLGFDPYPGTLNIRLDKIYIDLKRELAMYPAITIDGFSDGKRTYGWVKCYTAKINDKIDGAMLVLERTHHDESIMEVIAPVKIMDALGLRYGDRINVKVFVQQKHKSNGAVNIR
ncbi:MULTISPECIES: DUF120 domain-containing protein [Candidatus Nitrosocaldus]|jgi:riboflavin kinase|uniref:Riboflavin kinase n=1 Tax=Candidatus Nitrosocaldus cavascurensis TaxID=2058097 RepID=A0A2K5ARE1_9ARCH|nr:MULTISPECIES: DUF120 domain-containing protein [Candidatus Nitrosocaldus]SPC34164.1 Riboflavin kinase [Candidatus Nitrosocaldus cavascurensis]